MKNLGFRPPPTPEKSLPPRKVSRRQNFEKQFFAFVFGADLSPQNHINQTIREKSEKSANPTA